MIIKEAVSKELATVTNHGFALAKEKRTPYVWFDFQFDNLEGDNNESVTIKAYIYLTDSALPYALDKLSALGWNGKSVTELDPNEPDAFNFKGAKALLTVEMEDYDGKSRPKVMFINDPNYSGDSPVSKGDLSMLNAKLSDKIAAHRAKNGPGLTAVGATSPGTVGQKVDPNEEGKIVHIDTLKGKKRIIMESKNEYMTDNPEFVKTATKLWKSAKKADIYYKETDGVRVVTAIEQKLPF